MRQVKVQCQALCLEKKKNNVAELWDSAQNFCSGERGLVGKTMGVPKILSYDIIDSTLAE